MHPLPEIGQGAEARVKNAHCAGSQSRAFRKVVANACAELESRRQEVNDLNVFPVADGDTGDNMAMTMRAVLDELDRLNGQLIDEIGRDELVRAVARAALWAHAATAA